MKLEISVLFPPFRIHLHPPLLFCLLHILSSFNGVHNANSSPSSPASLISNAEPPVIRSDLPAQLLLNPVSGGLVRCQANGHPQPQVRWARSSFHELCDLPADLDNGRLSVQREGQLMFNPLPLRLRFRCVYHCIATNKHGQVFSAPVLIIGSKFIDNLCAFTYHLLRV